MVAEISVQLLRGGGEGPEQLVSERVQDGAGELVHALQEAARCVNLRLTDLIDSIKQPSASATLQDDEESDDDEEDEPTESSSDAKRKRK